MKKKPVLRTTLPGFSLIEMAIVLSILGLLLTGVFKGKQLYDSARLKAFILQVQDIQLAIHQFEQKFGALPGDFSKASTQLQEDLSNGNGDGIIDAGESAHVWSHLYAAGLLASPQAPISKIGGVISLQHSPGTTASGHWIVVGKPVNDNNFGALLTPEQAFSIDKKIDNGIGTSGKVRSMEGENGHASCFKTDGSYNLTNKHAACVLLVEY